MENFEAGLEKAMQLPLCLWGHLFVEPELQYKSLTTLDIILEENTGQIKKLQGVFLLIALTEVTAASNAKYVSERDFR